MSGAKGNREVTTGRAYPCLDGLRAFAVTLVFVFHGAVGSADLVRHFGKYIVHLNVGVEIFFVLSGFLIYRPFVVANLHGVRVRDLGGYARRRVLRIFPAYLVALFVLLALDDITVHGVSGFLKHSTLTYSYFRNIDGLGIAQSWTLVIELSFYAFVPLWAFVIRSCSRRLPALRVECVGVVALIAAGYVASWFTFTDSLPPPLTVLPPALGALGSGMLLAVLSAAAASDERLGERLHRLGRYPAAWWLASAGLFVLLVQLPYRFVASTPGQLMWDRSLKIPIALFLVVPAVFGNQRRGGVRHVLSARPVAYVGLVSYGIYLWHARISAHIATPAALNGHGSIVAVGALVVAFAATVAVATLSYFFIERPALRLAHRTQRTRSTAQTTL